MLLNNRKSVLAFLLASATLNGLMAQNAKASSSMDNGSLFMLLVVLLAAFLVLVVMFIGDKLLKLTAQQAKANSPEEYGVIPSRKSLFGSSAPDFVGANPLHRLSRGFDIKLAGQAGQEVVVLQPSTVAVKPTFFRGTFPIPKMHVQVGDKVKAGDILFEDKRIASWKFAAPVSGEVIDVKRGEKRSIIEVIILADKQVESRSYNAPSLSADRSELVNFLVEAGAWPFVRQRPFNIIADTDVIPRDIFISTFDTAPLAPCMSMVVKGKEAAFNKGLEVLAKLTSGKVVLGLDANNGASEVFANAQGVEKHYFAGQHPAGNVGVQIHHIRPINKGETVWALQVQDVATIGGLFLDGKFDASRVFAVCGNELEQPKYIQSYIGANVASMIDACGLNNDNVRIISGDVLTGKAISRDGFVDFYDNQVTVVAEGDEYEMFGWLIPQSMRPSLSKTFPGFLLPDYQYAVNTNTRGENRAFVVTGQYEQVLPMDIYPQHLMKAILAGDLEKMEGMGILELDEEDIAICEFVCTSKQPLQEILRSGLDAVQEQG